jgi:hypothetical protein
MQEMARLKAHMRYQEAKIARQNKIKSKSYRRHLRKQKRKEKEKELEELQVHLMLLKMTLKNA